MAQVEERQRKLADLAESALTEVWLKQYQYSSPSTPRTLELSFRRLLFSCNASQSSMRMLKLGCDNRLKGPQSRCKSWQAASMHMQANGRAI